MASRMEKYFETETEKSSIGSRSKKNEMLYKEINNSEIDKFEINSNATVLTEVKNNNNIDVEKIKKILDTKYNSAPKRKSIRVEVSSEEEENLDATKEYDINTILEKAKEEKVDDLEQDRLKKLKDTQFNILSNLNLSKNSGNDVSILLLTSSKQNSTPFCICSHEAPVIWANTRQSIYLIPFFTFTT